MSKDLFRNLIDLARAKPGFRRAKYKPGQDGEQDYRYDTSRASRDFREILAIECWVDASNRYPCPQEYVESTAGSPLRLVYLDNQLGWRANCDSVAVRAHVLNLLKRVIRGSA